MRLKSKQAEYTKSEHIKMVYLTYFHSHQVYFAMFENMAQYLLQKL